MKELFTKQQAFELAQLYLQKQLDDSQDEYDSAMSKDEKEDALHEVKIAQKMLDNFKIEEFDNEIESDMDGMEIKGEDGDKYVFYLDVYVDDNNIPAFDLEDIKDIVESYQAMHEENFEN